MNKNFTLDSAYDGIRLGVIAVMPEGKPEAVLQLSHGMCGCKERYLPFMEYMAGHGVACVAGDHRGHGSSVKSRDDLGYMYTGGYKALVEDMKLISDWSLEAFPGVPLFLLGHSMGSMAARIYAKKYDGLLSGMIICGSPGYVPVVRVGRLVTGFLGIFGHGRMRPAFLQEMTSARFNRPFASEGRMAWTCSDPKEREGFASNPLCNFSFTVNGMHNILGMMVDANSSKGWLVANPDMPVTFLSGSDDSCMGGEGRLHASARRMYSVGYHNVTAAIFPDMRHEILNEVGKVMVWNDILDFIHSAV